jgi:hypothetical protein
MNFLSSIQRNRLLTFLLVLLLSTSGWAQALSGMNPSRKIPVGPKLYAGLKIGANFSYLSGNSWSNGVKSNLLGGIFAGVKGGGFGIQGEALFEQSDYTTSDGFYGVFKNHYNNLGDSLKSGSFRVSKLSLPILLQMRIARLIWLQPGVQFYGVVGVKDANGLVSDAKKLFKNGAVAGVLGASLRLRNADLGARLIYDFQNLNNLTASENWRQFMLQAHIGIVLF